MLYLGILNDREFPWAILLNWFSSCSGEERLLIDGIDEAAAFELID